MDEEKKGFGDPGRGINQMIRVQGIAERELLLDVDGKRHSIPEELRVGSNR